MTLADATDRNIGKFHIVRMDDSRLSKIAIINKPIGLRLPRRPSKVER